MPRTRLTEEKRTAILRYMMERYDAKQENSESKRLFCQVVSKTNAAIRRKYPEDDMVVVRKYGLGGRDRCIRFSQASTGRVLGVEVPYDSPELELLADMPRGRGCYHNDVFPASDAFVTLIDAWTSAKDAESKARDKTLEDYRSFVRSCRTVEDAEAIMSFTPEMRKKLGAEANSLVVVNEGTLARIREEFSDAA